ncbi:DUF1996 domain-containing protein [Streptomyces sp. LP11]|uniref:DUF1996 domain-containing protein n=1 Tax=Streptomyces pyxinicus TaxID=2970331 RepID=A0ABT2B2B1_9ACTN|nr:DUF1996 domain-containing protein [Streptomyces sp. LP11]MCS0602649.1 DUF1996 domain-containing protein [Streptomyces sp. LP11]
MLAGGGLVAANVYASASEGWGDGSDTAAHGRVLSSGAATIDCPDVGSRLTDVPDGARADVDRELAALDRQTAAAYQRLRAIGTDSGAITDPLKEKRAQSIRRIADAIDRVGERPEGLDALAECTLRPGADGDDGAATPSGATQAPAPGGAGQGGNGPVVSDYADITSVEPEATDPPRQAGASRGTFASDCGVNAGGLFNSDNVIVAPGVSNGAHHFHDYVGNQGDNAFASDEDLAAADTSCVDQGDKSTYYWPVLRVQDGTRERDAGAPGGGTEGNAGRIVTPKQVTLTFVGNPREKVAAMPRLLRIITGDAKALVNGPGNANASWSCTGFEDRQLKDKYPLCPQGSDVVRTFRFQSCWDGRNTDSANHRTHVAFTDPDGSCPAGFRAIPQLVQRIVYDVRAPSVQDGGRTVPLFAVDSFPEQLHKPVTDHGDFIDVFDDSLMREMVDCINSGRTCGPRDGDGKGEDGKGDDSGTAPTPTGSSAGPGKAPGTDQATESAAPATDPARTTKRDTGTGTGTASPAAPEPASTESRTAQAPAAPAPSPSAPADSSPAQPTPAGNLQPPPVTQPEPQTTGGGLAETGAHLWPAALGTLLALSGLLMLLRARRLRY